MKKNKIIHYIEESITTDLIVSEAYERFQKGIEKITGQKRPIFFGKWTINKPITKL